MSLFIGTLAFENAGRDLGAPLRIGVLAGSLLSAGVGYALLRRATREGRLPTREGEAGDALERSPATGSG